MAEIPRWINILVIIRLRYEERQGMWDYEMTQAYSLLRPWNGVQKMSDTKSHEAFLS